jgi:hypothetical protein
MIDTNQLQQLAQAAPVVQSTFNAWHIVALGIGAAVTHVYHTVVNGGGLKKLWSNFYDGPAGPEAGAPFVAKDLPTPGEGTRPTENTTTISTNSKPQ